MNKDRTKAVNIKTGKVVFMSESYIEEHGHKWKLWKKPVVKRKPKKVTKED